MDRVKELTVDNNEVEKMVAKANKNSNKQIITLDDDKKNLSLQQKKVKGKLKRIIDSIENGLLKNFKSLTERIDSLEQKRKSISEKLKFIDFEISEIEKHRLSVEVVAESFRTFQDIINKARPPQLKELLFRIVEVVEWHENEKDRTAGHCKISYFEQPNLKMPTKKLSEADGDHLFAQSIDWLPSTDSNRGPSG